MTFGLTADGFVPKTVDDVLASIRTRQLNLFGASFAASLDTSVIGQLNGVFANECADLWDLAHSVWQSRYPSLAAGVSLDLVAEETGATRLPATKGTGTVTFTGSNGTVIPVGTVVRVETTGARFVTTEEVTIAGGTEDAPVEAEEYGPVIAAAGTLTEIVTPIAGVTAVTNALDIDVGRDIETDADFRIRRSNLLRAQGESTVAAVRSKIFALDDVDEVQVFNNESETTDSNGLPEHSFEAVVRGGDDQEIVDAIFATKPAGIQSYGTSSGTVTDANGDVQTIYFSRPTDVDMYVEVTLTRDEDVYGGGVQATGDAAVKQAIVDYWEAFDERVGKDVILNAFYGAIYAIPGVLQVTVLNIDDQASPSNPATTSIDVREMAVFDTSRIDVTS